MRGLLLGQTIKNIPRTPGADTIAYYQFDNNLNDSSGNNHNMTLRTGTATYGTTSQGGKYVYLDNNTWTNYWEYHSFNYDLNNTVSLWFNSQGGYTSGTHTIIEIWQSQKGFYRLTNMFRLASGVTTPEVYSGNINTWYNIVFVRSGSNAYWYINGQLVNQYIGEYSGSNETIRFRLNQVPDTNSSTYANDGYFSEVIWEVKAWTAQEVSNYFNQTKSLYGVS